MKTRNGLVIPDTFDKKDRVGTVAIDDDTTLHFKIEGNALVWTGGDKVEYDDDQDDWKTVATYTVFQATTMARVAGIKGITV